jgi:hypothetical protein
MKVSYLPVLPFANRVFFCRREKVGNWRKNPGREKSMRRKRPPKGEARGLGMSEEMLMLTGRKEWRQQHLTATFREIEEEGDARLAKLRAGMLEDLAKRSPQADWSQLPKEQRPTCEQCGTALVSRGKQSRWLQSSGGQHIEIERGYGTCPPCGQGIVPPG